MQLVRYGGWLKTFFDSITQLHVSLYLGLHLKCLRLYDIFLIPHLCRIRLVHTKIAP